VKKVAPVGLPAGLLGATLLLAAPLATPTRFREDFSSPSLEEGRWAVTAAGDFKESTVDVTGDRLRLRADTMGTRDDTVKFLGVRTRDAFVVGEGLCVAATLDWNNQANASYLSAALILAGAETLENPLRDKNWLAVEYIGVPPGRNARLQLSSCSFGHRLTLEDEGWPHARRAGRKIGEVRMVLFVAPGSTRLWENGKARHQSTGPSLSLEHVFLHLQISSHSNYRAREIYFDDVEVSNADAVGCERKARAGR
jgi:hypothetical protein